MTHRLLPLAALLASLAFTTSVQSQTASPLAQRVLALSMRPNPR